MNKKTFLVQTKDGWPIFDFQWELLDQLRNDPRLQQDFGYIKYDWDGHEEISTKSGWIPVGSVEFVHKYLLTAYAIEPSPLYIPDELMPHTGRDLIFNCTPKDVLVKVAIYGELFVKDARRVKGFTGILDTGRYQPALPEGVDLFHVSSVIDIVSEWRVFVHRGKILDCRNYSGDPLVFPNSMVIQRMVDDFTNSPVAYTLDVAVHNRPRGPHGTSVIEAHRFYSCGSYGFSSPKYPYMLSQAFYELVRENGKVD